VACSLHLHAASPQDWKRTGQQLAVVKHGHRARSQHSSFASEVTLTKRPFARTVATVCRPAGLASRPHAELVGQEAAGIHVSSTRPWNVTRGVCQPAHEAREDPSRRTAVAVGPGHLLADPWISSSIVLKRGSR